VRDFRSIVTRRGSSLIKAGRALVLAGLLSGLAVSPAIGGAAPPARAASAPNRHDATATAQAVTATASASASVDASFQTATPTVGGSDNGVASATATNAATATNTPTASATPTPTASPTQTLRPITLPKPVVHRTNGYQVGAYYFSGWTHAPNNNLTSLLLNGPLRKYEPLIGWYDDAQQLVDQNIMQASNAGINFFAFDYYDTARSPYNTDRALNEGLTFYLHSALRSRMNFCLNFIDQNPFEPKASQWPQLVSVWLSYFKQPDYVRVGGKPLFIIFSPEHMRDIFGSSRNVHRALDYLRARARAYGLPGVTVAVGASLAVKYNSSRIPQLRGEGYDVLTGYNYHSFGGENYRQPVPYDRLVQENRQMWDRNLKYGQPYFPVVTSGWDQRFSAREQSTAIIYSGRTPQKFACYVGAARRWVDTHPRNTVKEKIIMVFAWNETGEGGEIIPTRADRYAYTSALNGAIMARTAPNC